jgi:methanogenic corrinoid protein MtbC1
MGASRQRVEKAGAARLSIGALSNATGIPVETLRTWESRYDFPLPERKPSGHRVYPLASVRRLRLVGEALARGHRAGEVVPASEDVLQALLGLGGPVPDAVPLLPAADVVDLDLLVRYVSEFAAEPLGRALLTDWARLGPLRFLETRIVPLVRRVGEAWESGRLSVRHEHFASERLEDLLRALRAPFDERARGPQVVLATLPGERHALGLQMAALVLATAGCRVLYLGPDCPIADMVAAVKELKASVLAVSVSRSSSGAETNARLRRLRAQLGRRTILLLGGEGAPSASRGFEVIPNLARLEAWAQRLGARTR